MRKGFDGAPKRGPSAKYDLALYALALLPALAADTQGLNGLILGAGALVTMLGTSLLVSAFWKLLSRPVRGFAHLMFAAVLASMVQMVASVALPRVATQMGLYLPLTALCASLTAFPEVFDEDRELEESLVRALGRGALFLLVLTLIGCLREVLGAGAIFGIALGEAFQPMRMLSAAPGGFILAGVLLALIRVFAPKRARGGGGRMIDGAKVVALLFACLLTDNLVFSRFFGGLAAHGERPLAASARVAAAVALILTVTSAAASALYFYVLVPLKLTYLNTALSVVIIAAVFGLASLLPKGANPLSLSEPTPFHGLVALLSAFLGAALLSAQADSFLYGALTGAFYGAGFFLASVVLAGVRERLMFSDVPESLKGVPIGLVSAGLIALALLGFTGFGS